MLKKREIHVLDVSAFSWSEKVCAAALQGLLNRNGANVFLDYGIYDDPDARRTNEVFMDDEFWYGKYRQMMGNQDQHNLNYYQSDHHFNVIRVESLQALVVEHLALIKGCVVFDESLIDTVNIAVMQAAQQDLLVLSSDLVAWSDQFDLPILIDLRGKWEDRVELYQWAFDHLFIDCKPGFVACIEPGWNRPEFLDYIVQNKIFTYSLSGKAEGFGSTLLLLLAFGPSKLREFLFSLRLDAPLRRLGLAWMGWRSAEVRLSNRIQRAVAALPYPTIFGWHTRRDDELAFMLQLSSNGLRLVPSHLASNFSFHSQVTPLGVFTPDADPQVELDPQGIYITFTLSDGDQLMMMNSSELGNWHSPNRGRIPFNWETQPLLGEIAPALFEKYVRTQTQQDCLIAGPSGAGYIVPPLAPDFRNYMTISSSVCEKAGIRVVTTYVADPPERVMKELAKNKGSLLGYLSGYAIVERAPQTSVEDTIIIANEIPLATKIWDTAEQLLQCLQEKIDQTDRYPRFIGVHLFAYRTTLDDIARFVDSLSNEHIHVVRADEFLIAAQQHQYNLRK